MFTIPPPPAWASVPSRDRPLNPNSALLWLPPVVAAGLPVPATEIVRIDPDEGWYLIGEAGDERGEPFDFEAMRSAAASVGFPCFIRSDLSSGKHDGPHTYRADTAEDVDERVCATFADNAMKDLASGPTPVRAMMFRQWLDLDAPFAAFGFSGKAHPIAREWRIFASPTGVECVHFYWPADAIEDHNPTRPDWRALLADMEDLADVGPLREMALTAVRAIGSGSWSVDFARDRSGKWWLIDMATARSSWHPDHR